MLPLAQMVPPMASPFDDLTHYFADHGIPCRCQTGDFLALFDVSDTTTNGFGIAGQTGSFDLTMMTSDVIKLAIKHGTVITIYGKNYQAKNPERIDDGAFSKVGLSKA